MASTSSTGVPPPMPQHTLQHMPQAPHPRPPPQQQQQRQDGNADALTTLIGAVDDIRTRLGIFTANFPQVVRPIADHNGLAEQMRGMQTALEQRLTGIERRFTERLTGVEERLTGVEGRLTGVEQGLAGVRGDIQATNGLIIRS